MPPTRLPRFLILLALAIFAGPSRLVSAPQSGRFLYVAAPGIRNLLQYGGHGVLVFDIDHGHRFVRRIPFGGLDPRGKPANVKGICASAVTQRLYVSTMTTLTCIDLATDRVLWERSYDGGCDRLAISPDGKTLYVPSFEKEFWNILDAQTGDPITQVTPHSSAHNTIASLDGAEVYLAGLRSPVLTVVDAKTNRIARTVGPFTKAIRPFTINGSRSLVYVNVNELLGFEIGDLKTGKVLQRIAVSGFSQGPVKRHGCPSHGIALTPDEKELWLADSHNQRLHIFDNTAMPPRQIASIAVGDEPGWITFGIDGHYAYPSTGDVIDAPSRHIVTRLTDETGASVQSEKLLEIDFRDGHATAVGDQFGIGRAETRGANR